MRKAKFTNRVREGMKIVMARAATSMTPEERAQADVSKALGWMDVMKDWKSNRRPLTGAAAKKKPAKRRRRAA